MGITNEEAIEFCTNKIQFEPENEDLYKAIIKALEQQPSDDCISREAVIKHICESKECYKDECKGRLYKRCFDLQWIYALPSVTPQPKIGKWIAQDIHNCHTDFRCSECGYIHSFTHLYGEPIADYTYCPRCGSYNGGNDNGDE